MGSVNAAQFEVTTQADKPLLVSLHGIRTSLLEPGWQDELGELVDRKERNYESRAYGFLPAIFFLLPWVRERRLEWFRDRWDRIYQTWKVAPSIVAHSFGTYLVAEAMRKYPHIKFDRIVFCGSIVQPSYPWKQIHDREQFSQVLNQHGGLDFWAGIVQWGVKDAGPSGKIGFDTQPETAEILTQEEFSEWKHGDYFHRANYDRWLAFTAGQDLLPYKPVPPPRGNVRPLLVLSLIVIAVGAVLISRCKPLANPPNPTPTPTVVRNPFPNYFLLRSRASNKLHLDIAGNEGGIKDGDPLIVYYWTNTDNQIWTATPTGEPGWYYLETKNAKLRGSNQCLEIKGASDKYDAALVQGKKDSKPHQQWQLQELPSGFYSIRSKLNWMAINVPENPSFGSKLTMWNYNGGANQQWEIVKSQE